MPLRLTVYTKHVTTTGAPVRCPDSYAQRVFACAFFYFFFWRRACAGRNPPGPCHVFLATKKKFLLGQCVEGPSLGKPLGIPGGFGVAPVIGVSGVATTVEYRRNRRNSPCIGGIRTGDLAISNCYANHSSRRRRPRIPLSEGYRYLSCCDWQDCSTCHSCSC